MLTQRARGLGCGGLVRALGVDANHVTRLFGPHSEGMGCKHVKEDIVVSEERIVIKFEIKTKKWLQEVISRGNKVQRLIRELAKGVALDHKNVSTDWSVGV